MIEAWLESGLLAHVRAVVRPWRSHLVGGAVRDHLLGREPRDLDLVVTGAREAAEVLAAELDATLVELGGDRFAALRVVAGSGRADGGFVVDLWDPGEATLDDELRRRDLTINAIAVDLADGRWHDPTGGRSDLEARRLRATTEESFSGDPLRVLRLARLAAELPGFTVDPGTLALALQAAGNLGAVAAERRREEIRRSLEATALEAAVDVWAELELYPAWIGGDAPGAADAARAALEGARRGVAALGEEAEAPPVDRFVLHAALLLTAAEGDLAVPVASGLFTRREARTIALATAQRSLPAERPAERWFLHRAADQWPAAAVHAAVWDPACDEARRATRLRELAALASAEGSAIFDPEPLLRGDEIREILRLESGPEVGVAARRLRRAQVEGRVGDRRGAVAWLLSERRSADAD